MLAKLDGMASPRTPRLPTGDGALGHPALPHVTVLDPGNYTPDYCENLCRSLASLGAKVELITSRPLFEGVDPAPGGEFVVQHLFFRLAARSAFRRRKALRQVIKILSYPAGLWRTWIALKDRPPGVLHVQWALLPLLDALLLHKLRIRGWRIIFTGHEVISDAQDVVRRLQLPLFYRELDSVIVHSEGLAQQLRRYQNHPSIVVIPEGVIPAAADNGLPDRTELRGNLGLAATDPVFLFFGQIKPYKGLETLLQAWSSVVAGCPSARLLIAGEPMQDMRRIDELMSAPQIRGSIVARLAYVPRQDVPLYFCAADAVVLPYHRISMSGVIPLAWRFRLPAIASAVGGLPEAIRDGETGWLVEPGSVTDLARALNEALANRARLESMGQRAHDLYAPGRSWHDAAEATMALYEGASRVEY